ncbi:hypothetical protein BJ912DRAFT_1061536 [Pholiota molesta]|nr:hypothetical protein BJ912DRAFT_1061536 [Pholiota molesta]
MNLEALACQIPQEPDRVKGLDAPSSSSPTARLIFPNLPIPTPHFPPPSSLPLLPRIPRCHSIRILLSHAPSVISAHRMPPSHPARHPSPVRRPSLLHEEGRDVDEPTGLRREGATWPWLAPMLIPPPAPRFGVSGVVMQASGWFLRRGPPSPVADFRLSPAPRPPSPPYVTLLPPAPPARLARERDAGVRSHIEPLMHGVISASGLGDCAGAPAHPGWLVSWSIGPTHARFGPLRVDSDIELALVFPCAAAGLAPAVRFQSEKRARFIPLLWASNAPRPPSPSRTHPLPLAPASSAGRAPTLVASLAPFASGVQWAAARSALLVDVSRVFGVIPDAVPFDEALAPAAVATPFVCQSLFFPPLIVVSRTDPRPRTTSVSQATEALDSDSGRLRGFEPYVSSFGPSGSLTHRESRAASLWPSGEAWSRAFGMRGLWFEMLGLYTQRRFSLSVPVLFKRFHPRSKTRNLRLLEKLGIIRSWGRPFAGRAQQDLHLTHVKRSPEVTGLPASTVSGARREWSVFLEQTVYCEYKVTEWIHSPQITPSAEVRDVMVNLSPSWNKAPMVRGREVLPFDLRIRVGYGNTGHLVLRGFCAIMFEHINGVEENNQSGANVQLSNDAPVGSTYSNTLVYQYIMMFPQISLFASHRIPPAARFMSTSSG